MRRDGAALGQTIMNLVLAVLSLRDLWNMRVERSSMGLSRGQTSCGCWQIGGQEHPRGTVGLEQNKPRAGPKGAATGKECERVGRARGPHHRNGCP